MNSYQELLNREIYRRSTTGIIAHIIFIGLIVFFVDGFYDNTLYKPFPILMILLGVVLRTICLFAFKKKERIRKSIFLLATLVVGMGWGELAFQIIAFYGVESVQTMLAIGFMSTMIAISVSSLSVYPPALVIFLVTCTAYPCFILFSQKQVLWNYLGLFFVLNFIYQLFTGLRIYRSVIKQIRELSKERREKQRLQEIIDSIPSLVLIINNQKTYEMVNTFQDGLFQKVLLGNDLGVFPNSPVEKAFHQFLNSNESSVSLEIQAFDFGPEEWFMVTMNRLSFDRGIICNILPITEFVKTRNELQIQKARNEYSAKLITLGEVAANITHELGNPLAIVKGSIQVLKHELSECNISALATKKLDVIDATANRMGAIIRGLKAVSQREALTLSNVKFKDLLEPVKEITAQKLKEKNISLIINGEASEVDLFCDEVQISQVLLNLVDNAVDAISEEPVRWINITYRPGFEWCEITVQDSGSIKSQETKEKMMIPFYTTKNKEKGTGLGLSLSEKIIREHHGRLRYVHDEEHTTFLITLPRMTY